MLPKEWKQVPLHTVAEVRTGLSKNAQRAGETLKRPYLRVANVQDGALDLSDVHEIDVPASQTSRYTLQAGDLLLIEGNGNPENLGRGCLWHGQIPDAVHQNHVFAVRTHGDGKLLPEFLELLVQSRYGREYFLSCAKGSTGLASLNSSQLKDFPLVLPPYAEQLGIARVLNIWDNAIVTSEMLLANSRKQKEALDQDLLIGRARCAGFAISAKRQTSKVGTLPLDWKRTPIGELASEVSVKNITSDSLPVLSCTKHHGLVDSLSYFTKRVFSEDTSTYKVVPRGAFAYATNHIDEGSIGYQNLYDRALISPMYTVFKVSHLIDHGFLFKLLKTEHFRQVFAARTNASVDRRGSLRWTEFKKIEVPVPTLEEQLAICKVLDAASRELDGRQIQLDRLKQEKRALMADLLTGKRRVRMPDTTVEPEAA